MWHKLIIFFMLVNASLLTVAFIQFEYDANTGLQGFQYDPNCDLPVKDRPFNTDCRITFMNNYTEAEGTGLGSVRIYESNQTAWAAVNATGPDDLELVYFFNTTSGKNEILDNPTLFALLRNPSNQNETNPADIYNEQSDLGIFSLDRFLDFFDGGFVFNVFDAIEISTGVVIPQGFLILFGIVFGTIMVLGVLFLTTGRGLSSTT